MGFLGYSKLGIYLKISGIMLIFHAINGVCIGLLSREMQFKDMFIRTLIVLPLSALVCFIFMFLGFDLEALIAYNIANPLFTSIFMIALLMNKGYKMNWSFNFKYVGRALPYSLRVLLQDIGNVGCNSIRSFVMGGVYSSNSLAYYDRAFTYTSYVEESVTYTASSVLLPTMAKIQDDKERFNKYVVKSTTLYSLFIIPALLGFAAISPTFTEAILTAKWLPCVPYIIVFAIGFLHYPVLTIYRSSFLACGRSDITMKVTIIQNIISLLFILLTVKISPLWIAIGTSFSLLAYIPLYVFYCRKILSIPIYLQIGAMSKYMVLSVIMFFCIYPTNNILINDFFKMFIQVILGGIIYIALLFFTRDKLFLQLLDNFRNFIRGRL